MKEDPAGVAVLPRSWFRSHTTLVVERLLWGVHFRKRFHGEIDVSHEPGPGKVSLQACSVRGKRLLGKRLLAGGTNTAAATSVPIRPRPHQYQCGRDHPFKSTNLHAREEAPPEGHHLSGTKRLVCKRLLAVPIRPRPPV